MYKVSPYKLLSPIQFLCILNKHTFNCLLKLNATNIIITVTSMYVSDDALIGSICYD